MPKKNNSKRSKNNTRGRSRPPAYSRIDIARIRTFATITPSTSANTFVNNRFDFGIAAMGSRGIAYGDIFQLYRITELDIKVSCAPGQLGGANPVGLGNTIYMIGIAFKPISTYTNPSALTHIVDLPHSAWNFDYSPNMVNIHLGKQELLSSAPQKWYQTAATGSDDLEQVQLSINIGTTTRAATTVASQVAFTIHCNVEFRGPIDPSDIPLRQHLNFDFVSVNDEKKTSSTLLKSNMNILK